MAKKIKVNLTAGSVGKAIEKLEKYQRTIERKQNELCKRLAHLGAVEVSLGFSRAIYEGDNNFTVSVKKTDTGYAIVVSGESVAFIEFGAGATFGYGHPKADELGVGPGTYPEGKGHWDDPKGWWIPKEKGGGHSYGNPPNKVMFYTAKDLEEEIDRIAKEVFG